MSQAIHQALAIRHNRHSDAHAVERHAAHQERFCKLERKQSPAPVETDDPIRETARRLRMAHAKAVALEEIEIATVDEENTIDEETLQSQQEELARLANAAAANQTADDRLEAAAKQLATQNDGKRNQEMKREHESAKSKKSIQQLEGQTVRLERNNVRLSKQAASIKKRRIVIVNKPVLTASTTQFRQS